MTPKAEKLHKELLALFEPPEMLPLSDWSEKNIRLPEGSSARAGELRHWPYMRKILDDIGDPTIERVSVMKSARLGYTKGLMFGIGAIAAQAPAPIILLVPTDDDARRVAVEEIEPIFEESPALKGLVKKGKNDGRNTMLRKSLLGGGSIKILSAHAPRKLRAHDAKVLFIDEADGMQMTVEGDPISIAERRTFAHADRKIVSGSTPNEEGISVVERQYAESDQHIFEVPCPHCGAFNEIEWNQIKWPQDETGHRTDLAYYECPHCKTPVAERYKPQMVENGRWRALRPEVQGHRGFRINALVSLLANAAWGKLAAEWLKAKRGGPAEMQPFINLVLGKPWRVTVNRVDADTLRARVEELGLKAIPEDVLLITVGTDVQDDRLESTVLGWSMHGVPTALGHATHDGNTLEDEVWSEYDRWLKTKWQHPNGWEIGIDGVAVDSGGHEGRTQKVYDWCHPRRSRRIYAIKGVPGAKKIWEQAKKVKGNMHLHNVAVDVMKTQVLDSLDQTPYHVDGTRNDAGMRYSADLPDEWFDQVTAEVRRLRYVRNRPQIIFEPRRVGLPNHALDCCVYGWAVRLSPAVRSIDLLERSMRGLMPVPQPTPPANVPGMVAIPAAKPKKDMSDWSALFNG